MTHWEQKYLNLIQNNDECMKSHSSVAQYWQAKKAMEIFLTLGGESISDEEINRNYHVQHEESLNLLQRTIKKPAFSYLLVVFGTIFVLHYYVWNIYSSF